MFLGDFTKKNEKPPELEEEKKQELPPVDKKKKLEHEEVKELEGPKKVQELEDRLLRLTADFENFKRRSLKEHETLRETSTASMLAKLLPIVDEFGIAISHKSEDKEFQQGMEMIHAKLLSLLKEEGIEEMKALGESFDPYKHEAVRQGEGEEGKVIEVIKKGYMFKGKVLRHAKVVVGNGGEKK
jgi:molecular chaperone GrpE